MPTIVVLGAGIAAAPIIRQTMRNTVLEGDNYKLMVVSPNTHLHWPLAMPRAVVPGQVPEEKTIIPLESNFSQYPAAKFEHVLGKASSLETSSKLVTVTLNDGGSRDVKYDTLIIATGARTREGMMWKGLDTTDKTRAKLHAVQEQIKNAKTIVLAGGGITGTETAGELGYEYAKNGSKEVILIHEGPLLLAPGVLDSVRKQARVELEKLKVQVITDSKVVSVTPSGSRDTVIEIKKADGTTKSITAQAYLPCTGLVPNTEFVPSNLLDGQGRIKQTKHLQVEGHSDIFVVGDAGNLERAQALSADTQAHHLIKTLPDYFKTGKAAEYALNTKAVFGISIGRGRGVGQMGNFKAFSFIIWWIKGRYLGTDYSQKWAAGKMTMNEKFEN